MDTLARGIAAFFAAIAAFYMTLWVAGAILLPDNTPGVVRFLTSLAAAAWTARFVWRRPPSGRDGLARAAGTGALLLGTAGFVAGFFGPMIFAPGANQGPMLGLFITGPLGAVAGGAGGAIRWIWNRWQSPH